VQRGVIVGVRQVTINANGTVGAATGAAAGGVAGAQVIGGGPIGTAMGAIGGTLVGGIGGTAAAQAVTDMKGWEYIVQESGDKLVSVTQTSKTALPVGMHVLVIADTQQARIVPDYTVQVAATPPNGPGSAAGGVKPVAANSTATITSTGSTATEIQVSPILPPVSTVGPLEVAPIPAVSPSMPAAQSPTASDSTATPPAPGPTTGTAATPAATTKSSTAGTSGTVSTVPSTQFTAGASSSTPPVSSPSTATP
jgi:outer membrane lipoprotein SlyB